MLGATYVREVKPGEILKIDENGLTSTVGRAPKPALCIFEYVYFSRPDSLLEDQVHTLFRALSYQTIFFVDVVLQLIVGVREKLGMRLAKEAPPPPGNYYYTFGVYWLVAVFDIYSLFSSF
jgi:hypothetical protein